MPTFRIRRGASPLSPPIQADEVFSALAKAGVSEEETLSPKFAEEIEVQVISPLPAPRVYTSVRSGDREGEVWEGVSSGDRDRAIAEGKKWDGGKGKGVGVGLVDESVEVNRVESLRRKS